MLEVSEELKKAFMADNVEKQFRIEFPNGEHETITNEQIVANSVSFTESLCSKDSLKFGLCEANVFKVTAECENIKGSRIEVYADAYYNGEVYTVPYGVFTVDSCKLQAGTDLRNVEAYEQTTINLPVGKIEQFRRSLPTFTESTDSVDIRTLMYVQLPLREYKEEVIDPIYDTPFYDGSVHVPFGEDDRYSLVVDYYFLPINCAIDDNIYSVEGLRTEEYKQNVEEVERLLREINREELTHVKPNLEYFAVYNPNDSEKSRFDDYRYCYLDFGDRIYMKINSFVSTTTSSTGTIQTVRINIPYKAVIQDNWYEEPPKHYNFVDKKSIKLYQHIIDFDFPLSQNIVFKREVAIPTRIPTSSGYTMTNMYYIKDDILSKSNISQYVDSFLELQGLFGKLNKKGIFDVISINENFALYPEENIFPSGDIYPVIGNNYQPLTTTSYKAADYEETATVLYGYVRVTYLATDNEKYSITVECDPNNRNVYEMTNNYIFLNKVWTAPQVKEAILMYFYPNINKISYNPANVSIKGLPFLEAGDVIKVYADKGAFKTFLFRRTIKGEQVLTDSIQALGEEINPNADEWINGAGTAVKA